MAAICLGLSVLKLIHVSKRCPVAHFTNMV